MPKKKSKKVAKPKSVAPKNYVEHREHFYNSHPNIRVLLGLFIVSVTVLIGVMWRNAQIHMDVAEKLAIEGIIYNKDL